MYRTIVRGNLQQAEAMASVGGDLNWQAPLEEGAWSALHNICTRGNMNVLEWLLARNVDVNKRDVDGATPLHQAAHNGHHVVVAALLRAGSEVDAKDNDGRTSLWFASW